MKLYNEYNPRHREILREEIARASKMLREYNEKEIWDVLSVDQREELLMSVDDDMGPDFADEYAEEDWLKIPDAITNRIDLHRYKKGDYVGGTKRSADTYQRGIASIITDTSRFKNTKEMQEYVAKQIGSAAMNPDTLKSDLQKYASQYPGKMMQFNVDVQNMAEPIVSMGAGSVQPNPDFNPYDLIRRPGSNWTGD